MASIKITLKRTPSKKWNAVSNLLEQGPYAKRTDNSTTIPATKAKTAPKESKATFKPKRRFSLPKYTEEAKLRLQLFHSAEMGEADQIKHLLQRKLVDVNATDYDLVTALHRAAKYCQIEAVMTLLSWGADPNMTDLKNGLSPLHWLIVHSDPKLHSEAFEQCLVALVAAGASIGIGDFNGVSPLHYAVGKHYKSCVRLLMKLGAEPLSQDKLQGTALSIASDDMQELILGILDKENKITICSWSFK